MCRSTGEIKVESLKSVTIDTYHILLCHAVRWVVALIKHGERCVGGRVT